MSAITRRKTKEIRLHGRRWFQRTYGNTYCTCQIWINGEKVHKTPEETGYDSMYSQLGTQWLEANGYLPNLDPYESLWRYCERMKITLIDDVDDVSRERDL